MKQKELARLFFQEILKIHPVDTPPQYEDVQKIYKLLHTLFFNITEFEKIQFTTFFSRIAFAFQKYQAQPKRQFFIHEFRKYMQKPDNQIDITVLYQIGIKALTDAIFVFYQEEPPIEVLNILPLPNFYNIRTYVVKEKKGLIQVVVMEDDAKNEQFIAIEEESGEKVRVQYNIAERNENFRKSIAVLKHYFTFPVTLNLLDVEINTEGVLRPRAFVIEPDHLIDVTAIAECFKKDGADSLSFLLNKFLPYESKPSIMKGNIANFFLDELIANPNITFQDTVRKTFKINPLAFCLYDDREFKDILNSSQTHFLNLKRVVQEGFMREGIDREKCYLEPSFYAPKYGLQGRLDLFYHNPDTQKSAIVELKSGKPYMPNVYGISPNHYIQTLLYDLLIDSAFGKTLDPTNYILYSVLENDHLKFAPAIKAQQYEALNIRNQILALEQSLININRNTEGVGQPKENIFKRLISRLLQTAKGFERTHIELFDKVYNGLDDLEKNYFDAFASFIAREHQLAKVGIEGNENVNGVASLWLNNNTTKEENFDIFSYLKIISNKSHEEDALIVFEKTAQTNPLANFRIGDIVVLYPQMMVENSNQAAILNNQIFKCTLVDIQKNTITIRLRSRQLNKYVFDTHEFWSVEHDMLDSSFVGMYRGLFEFARSAKAKRDLLMTLAPPQYSSIENRIFEEIQEMTYEQNRIFQKIIHSKDYFLLWGPPGTGKTSVMLKHLVGHFYQNSEDNILLLAYTNRAVDEICEAIEQLGTWAKEAYIRIGSRYSTAASFHERLLDHQIGQISTRKELKELIQSKRIFVATVASMAGKQELFALKKFHRVIIDEASQILEPLLVGLLPQFEHFILIGDHKQLPAVVTQSESESAVLQQNLHDIGLKNLRNSFFERLYKRATRENWHWAYDVLSHQGRMHQDIMRFPSEVFYERKLQILPEGMNFFQLQTIDYQIDISDNLTSKLLNQRVLFLDTPRDMSNTLNKTNAHEAQIIADLIKKFTHLYQLNNRPLHPLSIGIITPYRAQIAQIQAVLRQNNFDSDAITIDTVERYQGGARDIILLSLCTNDPTQLKSLISLSEEGVDRKLNVALTRARQHLIVVGNAEILRGAEIYRWFVEEYS